MAALIVLPAALAGHAFEDEEWRQQARDVELTAGWDGFQWSAAGDKELLSLDFDANAGTFYSRMNQENGGSASLNLSLESLIEFKDQDGDGRFGLGDPVIQHIRWSDLRPQLTLLTDDAQYQNTSTQFYSNNGQVRATVIASFADAPGQSTADVAISVEVTKFPFDTDNQTRLALVHRADAALLVHGGSMAYLAGEVAIGLRWGNPLGNASGLTTQTYGSQAAPETLVVTSHPWNEPASSMVLVAFHETPPASIPGFLEDLRVSDWRLWAIGLLIAGLITGVTVARKIIREQK